MIFLYQFYFALTCSHAALELVSLASHLSFFPASGNVDVDSSSSFPRSDAIYSALYDGTGHIEVLRGHEYLSHPFAVTLYGGEVYWTDWRTNTLAKANKWTGHNVTVVQRTNTQPFDLQVYHPSRQPVGEP